MVQKLEFQIRSCVLGTILIDHADVMRRPLSFVVRGKQIHKPDKMKYFESFLGSILWRAVSFQCKFVYLIFIFSVAFLKKLF